MADLTQRLSLIVDATGGGAEATFRRLTQAAESTSSASKDSGTAVAAAADRVAAAKLKEADAYGRLRVEEQRLEDLRNKANATGAQLAAAEERVESARRRVQSATADLTRSTEQQEETNRRAAESSGEMGDAADEAGGSIKDLAGTVAGLVGGFSLVDYIGESVTGFMDLARGASGLAASMNATVEQGGQLAAMFGAIGLESSDLLEIQAEFAGKIADSTDGLTEVGTQTVKNADGTVNWALTLQDALAQLQKIPDATERNRAGFAMFGEEGYKQLSQLVNSGKSVEQAFAEIGMPITPEDVAAVQEYDSKMLDLQLTSGRLGQAIGRIVVPALTMFADLGMEIADAIDVLPGPTLALGGAAVLLGVGMRSAAVEGGVLAGVMARVSTTAAGVSASMGAAFASTTAFAGAAGRAAAASLAFVGGPIGAVLIAAGGAYYFAQQGADAFAESTRKAAAELTDANGNLTKNQDTLEDTAEALVEQAGYWEQATMAARGYRDVVDEAGVPGWIEGTMDALGAGGLAGVFADDELAARGAREGIEDAAEAVKGLAEQQETARATTESLTTMIAEGKTTGEGFAAAVREAAEAQRDEAATSDLAKAALDAYEASTRGAAEATFSLFEAQISGRGAYNDVVQAAQDLAEVQEDVKTNVGEGAVALDELLSAVLNYGKASGETAIANARLAGEIVTPLREAEIRAQQMVQGLRDSLNVPDLTDTARAQITHMITKLEEAQARGDVEAVLTLTGADEAAGELDETTKDRDTTVRVESRNGPEVISYLDGIAAADRMALIRVESRNGPAVQDYLRGLAIEDRLALIRVESRNGPAVDGYIDSLTRERLAIIRVETRGGPQVDAYLDNLASQARTAVIGRTGGAAPTGAMRGAPTGSFGAGSTSVNATLNLQLTGTLDRSALSRAEAGRVQVQNIRAYEQKNGTGWRRGT